MRLRRERKHAVGAMEEESTGQAEDSCINRMQTSGTVIARKEIGN